jgi:hypothetical protein
MDGGIEEPLAPALRCLAMTRILHIPADLVVESFSHSLISSRREDLQIEQPISCRDSPAFHFYTTLPRMLGATLIGHQVIQVREPREKRLLVSTGMMKPLHREEFSLNGVVGLV